MRVRKSTNPIDYSKLFKQTVTVYHKDGDNIVRTVHDNAFFEFKKTQNVDKTARKEANSFLLVIPGNEQAVFAGDKAQEGDGPEIAATDWTAFNPKEVPNLVVVSYADPKKYNGVIVHTEAGG
jgi:hypothetical protein